MLPSIKETLWDNVCLGMPTYELNSFDSEIGNFISNNPGHYTLKIDPLASKESLERFGFYYCDTLMQPYCTLERFKSFQHKNINLQLAANFEEIIPVTHNAWSHGRFHRDFQIDHELANKRYLQWMNQLFKEDNLYVFRFHKEVAGFVGCVKNSLVLHALSEQYRGRGLAKYFWTSICELLFSKGFKEITSSISTANTPILNLYCSLGFKFRNPQDVYHYLQR